LNVREIRREWGTSWARQIRNRSKRIVEGTRRPWYTEASPGFVVSKYPQRNLLANKSHRNLPMMQLLWTWMAVRIERLRYDERARRLQYIQAYCPNERIPTGGTRGRKIKQRSENFRGSDWSAMSLDGNVENIRTASLRNSCRNLSPFRE
jgi:hypothetical protein